MCVGGGGGGVGEGEVIFVHCGGSRGLRRQNSYCRKMFPTHCGSISPPPPVPGMCRPIWLAPCKTGPASFPHTSESSSYPEDNVKGA